MFAVGISGHDRPYTGQDRPYFHYGPFGRTKTKWRWHRHKTSCRYVTYSRFGKLCLIVNEYIVILFL